MWGGTKETNLSLHHAHSDIHYVCKYIIIINSLFIEGYTVS